MGSLKKNRASKEEVEKARIKGPSQPLQLQNYAGKFSNILGGAEVTFDNNHLVLGLEHTPSFTGDLEHWHYDAFQTHWWDPVISPGLVTFPLNTKAEVSAIKFDQPHLLDVDFGKLNFLSIKEGVANQGNNEELE